MQSLAGSTRLPVPKKSLLSIPEKNTKLYIQGSLNNAFWHPQLIVAARRHCLENLGYMTLCFFWNAEQTLSSYWESGRASQTLHAVTFLHDFS